MLARHENTRQNSTNTLSKHLRASQVAGETNSARGVLGRGIWPKRHSAPQDAARSSRIAKSARATRNHTHIVYKCSLPVHLSAAGQGQRKIETRRSRKPPEMRASKYGRVLEVDIGKNTRAARNQPRTDFKCILLAIRSGAGRGERKTRVQSVRAHLRICLVQPHCNGHFGSFKTRVYTKTEIFAGRTDLQLQTQCILSTAPTPYTRAHGRATRKQMQKLGQYT
jgi:hypothetical protein